MAEKRNSRKDELGIRANEPNLSHSFDDENIDQQFEDEGDETPNASGKSGGFLDKITKNPGSRRIPTLPKALWPAFCCC